jgi:uncharacterized protein YneF (UPF0154 family)
MRSELKKKKEFQKDDIVKKPKFNKKNIKKPMSQFGLTLPTRSRNNQTVRKVKKNDKA